MHCNESTSSAVKCIAVWAVQTAPLFPHLQFLILYNICNWNTNSGTFRWAGKAFNILLWNHRWAKLCPDPSLTTPPKKKKNHKTKQIKYTGKSMPYVQRLSMGSDIQNKNCVYHPHTCMLPGSGLDLSSFWQRICSPSTPGTSLGRSWVQYTVC